MNGWSRVVASQNGGLTSYIFLFRLRVLQWNRHLFNYWKNKKIIIKKNPHFINLKLNLHLIIGKLHDFGPRYNLR